MVKELDTNSDNYLDDDLLSSGITRITHRHDGETIEPDGINSDGGAFPFTTTGTVAFVQPITVTNNAVDTTAGDYRAIETFLKSTAGSNQLRGIVNEIWADGGSPSVMSPLYAEAKVKSGSTVGYVYNYFYQNLDGGTVTNDVYGLLFSLDQEAGNTIGGNAISLYVAADMDGTVSGSTYMLYLNEATGVDYGIYQSGTASNVLGGDLTVPTMSQIGGASHYSSFEADGTLKFNGNATVWDDLRVPLSSIKRLGFTDPDWVQFKDDGSSSTGVYALAFDKTSDEEVYFSCQLPHSYKLASDITPHVHWAPSSAAAGGVTWGLEYTWVNINGTYGNTTIITADDSTDSTSHKHHLANFSALTGTGMGISSMLMCRLFRDVSDTNDTYAADAFLLEIDFHFEMDTVGSRLILTK